MAKFEVGDKVKFLNQVGGGVVTKVTKDYVFVQDETGFDIPMQPRELIRMADMEGVGKVFNQEIAVEAPVQQPQQGKSLEQRLKEKFSNNDDENVDELKSQIKTLKSQVANLKEQVANLKKQLSHIQSLSAQKVSNNILSQHMNTKGEAEVDLHIERLSDRPADLSPHEALQTQLRYFRTCMNHAILNNVKKVTFIHGVGKGTLKDEIIKELKQYDGIHFFDAPMSVYGVGATEVFFSNNASKN